MAYLNLEYIRNKLTEAGSRLVNAGNATVDYAKYKIADKFNGPKVDWFHLVPNNFYIMSSGYSDNRHHCYFRGKYSPDINQNTRDDDPDEEGTHFVMKLYFTQITRIGKQCTYDIGLGRLYPRFNYNILNEGVNKGWFYSYDEFYNDLANDQYKKDEKNDEDTKLIQGMMVNRAQDTSSGEFTPWAVGLAQNELDKIKRDKQFNKAYDNAATHYYRGGKSKKTRKTKKSNKTKKSRKFRK